MISKRSLWWLVFIGSAVPSAYLLVAYIFIPRHLGVDPTEVMLQETGQWALRFLILTLMCSPARRMGIKQISRFRRMLGLYTFYYATFHLGTYLIGWIELDLIVFLEDIYKRPFIYIGLATWAILLTLAISSPKWVVKLLKQRWVLLHKLVFVAILGAWVHLWMQSRASAAESLIYLAVIIMLVGERLFRRYIARRL